jgi:hypothetical protein
VVADVEAGGFRLGDVKHLTGDGRGREVAQGVQLPVSEAGHECAQAASAGQKENPTACILSRQTKKGVPLSVRDVLATVQSSKAASTSRLQVELARAVSTSSLSDVTPFAPGLGASCAVFLAKCALNFQLELMSR